MSAEMDEAAARWHLAQADDNMDWSAFEAWLQADPRHREAYDAIALLDARIDAARPALSQLLPAEDEPARRRSPRAALWGAIAAILVAVIALSMLRLPSGGRTESVAYRAPVGHPRDVSLPGGSTAALAPGSVLHVANSRDLPMTLEGAAFFDVRHDSAHPMIVQAGTHEIRDVGTQFDVSMSGGMVRIAVAEGRVAVRSFGVAGEVEVEAGKALTLTGAGGAADMRPVQTSSIGAWRRGALVYDDVPLAMVAADIGRSSGQPVMVDRTVAQRRFSGVIALGDRAAMATALSDLTGLTTRTDGDAIRIGDSAGR